MTAFVDAFNDGDVQAWDGLLDGSFFDYEPRPGEQSQAAAFAEVASEVRAGFPDGRLSLLGVEEDGDELVAPAVFAGHYTGTMFGVPGRGQEFEVRATLRARSRDGRLAIAFEDVSLVSELRAVGVLPYPSFAHLAPENPAHLPEVLFRLAFGGQVLQEKPCSHLDQIQVIEPQADVCAECVASGDAWPALRQCLTCGYVGCCDVAVNKHMRRHIDATGHPLMRSIMPGEAWIWCYPDSAVLSSWHLANR